MTTAGTPSEIRLALTRVCLRSGSVVLPGRARSALPADGTIEAYDPEGQDAWELELADGRLHGLGPFLERHGLAVNDEVVLRVRPDGHVVVRAQPRARSASRDAAAVRRAVAALTAGGAAKSVEELREEFGLASDVPLEPALQREPLLEQRQGRWALVGAGDGSPRLGTPPSDGSLRSRSSAAGSGEAPSSRHRTTSSRASAADPPPNTPNRPSDRDLEPAVPTDSASPETLRRARTAFETLGYRVAAGRGGTLALDVHLGRVRHRILARVLDEGAEPDWTALLRSVRAEGADKLALIGDVRDLTRLERPARGARASLFSWDGLQRVAELARTVPIGPVDLAPSFEEDGLHGAGLRRFEARIERRLREQGRFSLVVERLATLRAPAVFSIDDIAVDAQLSRESILEELERMSAPPLQWIERRGPGEFALRQSIPDALAALEAFARSLRERCPDPKRPRVRGSSAGDGLLGEEDLRSVGQEERPERDTAEVAVDRRGQD